nr:MAG TPA: hypothetical protein [Caudoviricetes sp.]
MLVTQTVSNKLFPHFVQYIKVIHIKPTDNPVKIVQKNSAVYLLSRVSGVRISSGSP